MQTFIARVRAFFAPRYDASTGQRRRRSLPAVAAGAVLALLLGSGVAVAATSSAEAHNWAVNPSCSSLSVNLTSYNTNNGGTNTVTVTVDGTAVLPTQNFSNGFSQVFPLNAAVAHTYSVVVTAHDDPTASKNWAFTKTGTTTPCATPTVSLTPSVCTTPGGTTDLVANFANLDQSHTYTVALSSAGGTNVPAAAFVATGTTGSKTFTGLAPGFSYTVTIVDTTSTLNGSASVYAVGCPQDSALQVAATECTVSGGSAQFAVTASSLVNGRSYTIELFNTVGNVKQDSATFTADASGTTVRTFAVPPSGSYYAVITDDAAGSSKTSSTITFLPCPGTPGQPVLTVTECDAVPGTGGGAIAFAVVGGTIDVSVTGLVPGRTYDIVVKDASNVEVHSQKNYTAASSTYTVSLPAIAAGVYTATVTDVLVPSYTSSQQATMLPCPTYDTTISLSPTECTEPGQTVQLSATIADYAVGRSYTVALLQGGVQVGATKTFNSATGTPQTVTFTGLTPGLEYLVRVTDDNSVPLVTASESVTLESCPGLPTIKLTPGTCSILGVTDINIALSDLEVGKEYVVSLTTTSDGKPVPGLADRTFTATLTTATGTFAQVPFENKYTVTVTNKSTPAISASVQIDLPRCDLPTFPLPPEEPPFDLPTLALTGSGPAGQTVIAGVLLLQLGLALVGVALLRRRSREV